MTTKATEAVWDFVESLFPLDVPEDLAEVDAGWLEGLIEQRLENLEPEVAEPLLALMGELTTAQWAGLASDLADIVGDERREALDYRNYIDYY